MCARAKAYGLSLGWGADPVFLKVSLGRKVKMSSEYEADDEQDKALPAATSCYEWWTPPFSWLPAPTDLPLRPDDVVAL